MNKRHYEHVSRLMREEKEIKKNCRKQWKEEKNNCTKRLYGNPRMWVKYQKEQVD